MLQQSGEASDVGFRCRVMALAALNRWEIGDSVHSKRICLDHKNVMSNTEVGYEYPLRGLKIAQDDLVLDL